jgi:hypothetical protein
VNKFVEWAEHLIATEPPSPKTDGPVCKYCKVRFAACACSDCMSEYTQSDYCHLCLEMHRAAIRQPGLMVAQRLWEANEKDRRYRMGL